MSQKNVKNSKYFFYLLFIKIFIITYFKQKINEINNINFTNEWLIPYRLAEGTMEGGRVGINRAKTTKTCTVSGKSLFGSREISIYVISPVL